MADDTTNAMVGTVGGLIGLGIMAGVATRVLDNSFGRPARRPAPRRPRVKRKKVKKIKFV